MSNQMKCPICNQKPSTSVMEIEYKGELYGFCCPYCRERFLEECEIEFLQSSVTRE